MSVDLSQLRAALAEWDEKADWSAATWPLTIPATVLIAAAARLVERLLPGVCADCEGSGQVLKRGAPFSGSIAPGPCGRCDGSGQVWDEGIVEAVAKYLGEFAHFSEDRARGVLAVLVELLTEKVKT